ncbi:MAG TPA: TIGR03842 family LLM class F420-dependent oxidoreductase [Candidatus Limnocylindrales bacterium]
MTLPDQPAADLVPLAQAAEAVGFDYVWLFDSPLMDRDPYPLLAAIALGTTRVRFGTCVTNPSSRDPVVTASALATLAEMSHGRVDLGIGRGDSALRLVGRGPASLAETAAALLRIRELVEGRTIDADNGRLDLSYATGARLPVWLAGYGPRTIALAARIADGIVIQVADPELVAWFVAQLRAAEVEADRARGSVAVMVAAAALVGDDAQAIERVRWFPALVANHVADLLRRQPAGSLPAALTEYLGRRPSDGYIPQRVGDYSFVEDDVVRRMTIVGSIEAHRARIADLVASGADQVNLYLERGEEARTIAGYGADMIPGVGARALE